MITTGVTGVLPQQEEFKLSQTSALKKAQTATVWASTTASCSVQCASGHAHDFVVVNHGTGKRQLVPWDIGETSSYLHYLLLLCSAQPVRQYCTMELCTDVTHIFYSHCACQTAAA